MQKSPYTPGTIALEIPGREQQLEMVSTDLQRVADLGKMNQPFEIFVGPRGIGKTSLLRKSLAVAEAKKFEVVWVTAGDGSLFTSLIAESYETIKNNSNSLLQQFKDSLQSVKFTMPGIAAEFQVNSGSPEVRSNHRVLEAAFKLAAQAAVSRQKKGFVVFIDELQQADKDSLTTLAFAWQHLQAEASEMPLAIFTAGLGDTREVLIDAASFAERFSYRNLTNLSRQESERALVVPARKLGVSWQELALQSALELAEGYPYFLQLIGEQAWQAANNPDVGGELTAEQIPTARESFQAKREELFDSRLKKVTDKELDFLKAMASLAKRKIKRAEIAKALGVSTTDVSSQRASLLSKGLIAAPEYGYLQFTAPGFGAYIREYYDLEIL